MSVSSRKHGSGTISLDSQTRLEANIDLAEAETALALLKATADVCRLEFREDCIYSCVESDNRVRATEVKIPVSYSTDFENVEIVVKTDDLWNEAHSIHNHSEVKLTLSDGEDAAKTIHGNLMGYLDVLEDEAAAEVADMPDFKSDYSTVISELSGKDLKSAVLGISGASRYPLRFRVEDEAMSVGALTYGTDEVAYREEVPASVEGEDSSIKLQQNLITDTLLAIRPSDEVEIRMATTEIPPLFQTDHTQTVIAPSITELPDE